MDVRLKVQPVPGRHAPAPRTDRHVGGDDIRNIRLLLPGEDDGIQMIDMFMGNEDIDLPVARKLLRKKLAAAAQLAVLPPPVIKNEKKVSRLNGKTAVIIMSDSEL